jgi:outer membrane lipoprotein-sorting protein
MKKVMLAIAVALASAVSINAQTVDEVIDSHIKARGGAEKLSAVKTAKMEATMSVMGMDLPLKMSLVQGRAVRTDISAMGQEVITVIDGDKGWILAPPMGVTTPTAMPEDQLKSSASQMDISNGLLNYKASGAMAELIGKEKIDGADVFKVKMTLKNGMAVTHYFDAGTYNLIKSGLKVGDTDAFVTMSNYKMVDGISFPFTTEVTNPQMGAMVTNFSKIELNTPVDEAIFAMPKN